MRPLCRLAALAVFLLIVALFSSPSCAAGSGRWELIGFTKYRDALFLDRSSLTRDAGGKAAAEVKIAPSRKSKYFREIRADLRRAGKSDRGFKYALIRSEVDCPAAKIRHVRISYHRKDGKMIHSAGNPDAGWKPVEPGSLWDSLRNAVCGGTAAR